jgi:hypothetical protein
MAQSELMRVLVLVGAGATLAEALPTHPRRDRTPPLDTTFFDLCRLADLHGRGAVRAYLVESFGIDPFDGEHRMEEVFNYLYSQAFADNPTLECLEAYWGLIRMYSAAIARTTNPLSGTSRYGVGALLRHLWRNREDCELTFVTFNQDLVIEKALTNALDVARYGEIPWSILDCYGIDFQQFLIDARDENNVMSTRPLDESLKIFKMHGSLNWVYTVRSGHDPKNSVRNPTTALRCVINQRVRADIQATVGAGQRGRDLLPVVVPPIYEKASRYGQVVGAVWSQADEAIRNADELVVFGYSFPDADFAARSLLRSAYHHNPNLSSVSVIDVSSEIAARVATMLDVKALHHYRSVPAFVEDFTARA